MDRRKFITSLIAFGMGTPVSPSDGGAGKTRLETYGDIGQIGIPISGLLMAICKSDRKGARQVIEGAFWNSFLTLALKHRFNARRPNGGSLSFPSGHTSNAAQGAAFIFFRYGHIYGLVAYLAAALVAYSRVASRYHYWRDVAAGIILATTIQYLITVRLWSVLDLAKDGG